MNSLERFFQHLLYDFHVCNLIKEFTGPRPTWQTKLDHDDKLNVYTIYLETQVIHIRFVDGWNFQIPIQQMRTWVENATMYKKTGYQEIRLNYKLMKNIVDSFKTCDYCGLQRNCLTYQHCSECSVKQYCPECYDEFSKDTSRYPECAYNEENCHWDERLSHEILEN